MKGATRSGAAAAQDDIGARQSAGAGRDEPRRPITVYDFEEEEIVEEEVSQEELQILELAISQVVLGCICRHQSPFLRQLCFKITRAHPAALCSDCILAFPPVAMVPPWVWWRQHLSVICRDGVARCWNPSRPFTHDIDNCL